MTFANTVAAALAASSLIVAPIAAQAAAPAQRTSAKVTGDNLHGGWFIGLLALAAVIAGLVILLDNGNDTLPRSP